MEKIEAVRNYVSFSAYLPKISRYYGNVDIIFDLQHFPLFNPHPVSNYNITARFPSSSSTKIVPNS